MKNLLSSIFFSSILGVILLIFHLPGAVIAFGIIAGSLFWGLSLLVDIQEKLSKIAKHLNVKDEEIKKLNDYLTENKLEDDLNK